MKWLGRREVRCSDIRTSRRLSAIARTEWCRALADSIDVVGLLEPVLVTDDLELLDGHDRLAAHLLLNEENIMADVVQADDLEREAIPAVKRGMRKHDQGQQYEALEKALRALEKALPPPPGGGPRKRGRPVTARGAAVRAMAAARGVTPQAIWNELSLAKRRVGDDSEAPRAVQKAHEWIPESWGMELSQEELDLYRDTKATYARIIQALGAAKVNARANDQKPWTGGKQFAALAAAIDAAAQLARDSAPGCVCPYCKAFPPVRLHCEYCDSTGLLAKGEMGKVPEALKSTIEPAVAWRGRVVPLSHFEAPLG